MKCAVLQSAVPGNWLDYWIYISLQSLVDSTDGEMYISRQKIATDRVDHETVIQHLKHGFLPNIIKYYTLNSGGKLTCRDPQWNFETQVDHEPVLQHLKHDLLPKLFKYCTLQSGGKIRDPRQNLETSPVIETYVRRTYRTSTMWGRPVN